jgi:hypothetical protein
MEIPDVVPLRVIVRLSGLAGVFQFRGNQATAFEFAATASLSLKNAEIRLRKIRLAEFSLVEKR